MVANLNRPVCAGQTATFEWCKTMPDVMRISYNANDQRMLEAQAYVEGLSEVAQKPNGTFDSAAASDFTAEALSGRVPTKLPKGLEVLFEELDDKQQIVVQKAILDGVHAYEYEHGVNPPPDLLYHAFHNAYSTSMDAAKRSGNKALLDSVTNAENTVLALQPNRAQVAVYSILAEACSFAMYLPADIGSNRGQLIIVNNTAGSLHGEYAVGNILDGINSGDTYLSTERIHKGAIDGSGNITGKLTAVQTDEQTCNQSLSGLVMQRNAARVYINGQIVARETESNTGANSTISGAWTDSDGTLHSIGGYITVATGTFALTSSPAIPDSVDVLVADFIDLDTQPTLIPSFDINADRFDILAHAWQGKARQNITSRTQLINEAGIDPYSQQVLAFQQQYSMERHYASLRYMKRIASLNSASYNFNWSSFGTQKTRAQIWGDFNVVLGVVDQQMNIDTLNHGVTHMYVGKHVAAQFKGLPPNIWQPSGVPSRPGIYRLGRLFNQVDVYYTPKGITEATDGSTAEILLIGRATDVVRNPIIWGDAFSPVVRPLPDTDSLQSGAAFYARSFTEVNPHGPSSLGAAIINVTNLW